MNRERLGKGKAIKRGCGRETAQQNPFSVAWQRSGVRGGIKMRGGGGRERERERERTWGSKGGWRGGGDGGRER